MTDSPDNRDQRVPMIDGECRHCDWYAVTDSYPKIVKLYQDHLREQHPNAWLTA